MWWTTIQLILLPICHLYLWNAHGALGANSHNCGFNLPKYLQIWMNAIFLKEIVQFSKRMILISWLFLHNIFTTYLYFCCVFFWNASRKKRVLFLLVVKDNIVNSRYQLFIAVFWKTFILLKCFLHIYLKYIWLVGDIWENLFTWWEAFHFL